MIEDVAVISWNGPRFIGIEVKTRLEDEITSILEKNIKKIVINFPSVIVIDSSGLGNLIKVWNLITSHDSKLTVVIASGRIDQILKITNLNVLMDIFKSLDEALEFYAGDT